MIGDDEGGLLSGQNGAWKRPISKLLCRDLCRICPGHSNQFPTKLAPKFATKITGNTLDYSPFLPGHDCRLTWLKPHMRNQVQSTFIPSICGSILNGM